MNDPFEFCPCWEEVKQGIVERVFTKIKVACDPRNPVHKMLLGVMNTYLKYSIEESLNDDTLILSLSKKRDNSIMWSHYANSHRGFVIGFDAESVFFQGANKLKEVFYSGSRYVIPANAFIDLEIPSELSERLIDTICFTKNADWQYEQEMRLLADRGKADHVLEKESALPIYLFDLPAEIVKEVIMGYRIEPDFKGNLLNICDTTYPDAKIFQAFPHKKSYDLAILSYAGK